MRHTTRLPWLLSGLAILVLAPMAQAAKPTTTAQERKAAIAVIKQNHKQFEATQPRTMAQADATVVHLPSGATAMRAPTELWNHLAIQKDAQGNVYQVEGSSDQAPTAVLEGLPNE